MIFELENVGYKIYILVINIRPLRFIICKNSPSIINTRFNFINYISYFLRTIILSIYILTKKLGTHSNFDLGTSTFKKKSRTK